MQNALCYIYVRVYNIYRQPPHLKLAAVPFILFVRFEIRRSLLRFHFDSIEIRCRNRCDSAEWNREITITESLNSQRVLGADRCGLSAVLINYSIYCLQICTYVRKYCLINWKEKKTSIYAN